MIGTSLNTCITAWVVSDGASHAVFLLVLLQQTGFVRPGQIAGEDSQKNLVLQDSLPAPGGYPNEADDPQATDPSAVRLCEEVTGTYYYE